MKDLLGELSSSPLGETLLQNHLFNHLIRLVVRGSHYKNYVLNAYEKKAGKTRLRSLPVIGSLNPIATCNLRCAFCEIHYLLEIVPKISANAINIDVLERYAPWLKGLAFLELSGGIGEPLLNPHFATIVDFLKKEFDANLSVTTNGLLLNETIRESMVANGFDTVLVSVHGGRPETYRMLHGADLGKVVENVEQLIDLRTRRRQTKPRVGLNFALNRLNAGDVCDYVHFAKKLEVGFVLVQHYYDVRNKLSSSISFHHSPEEGNEYLRQLYQAARDSGLRLDPLTPALLPTQALRFDDCTPASRACFAPWEQIRVKEAMGSKDCHYVGVCNRIQLFKINYREYCRGAESIDFEFIWNHPVLQHLRSTVNTKELNPLCRFCKNPARDHVRCVDNEEYRRIRDNAIRDFFREAAEHCSWVERPGLEVLTHNPTA